MTKPTAVLSCIFSILTAFQCNASILTRAALVPAANASLPTRWSYVGCYNDTQQVRTLQGGATTDKAMNGSTCAKYCNDKKFVYAGTEYSNECYCGNQLGAPSALQNDTKCSMSCAGNSSEACGGANFISIYYTNKPAPAGPVVNPGPANWTSYGCYTDGNPRSLANGVATPGGPSNMTVALCTATCGKAGYTLAGLEYAQECHCDNYLAASASQAVLADCNMPCNGNSSEFCGAGNRLNMYASGGTKPGFKPGASSSTRATSTAVSSSTAAATGASKSATSTVTSSSTTAATPSNGVDPAAIAPFKYAGCYTDTSSDGRSIANRQTDDPKMTVESCIKVCSSKGFTVAGVQYAQECYCDNFLRNSPTKAPDSDCSMNCVGSPGEKCGAGGRNSVYTNGTITNYQPPGPLTNLPGNWSYTGCIQDNVNNVRVFPYEMIFQKNNSNTYCLTLCQQYGYSAAATEYGEQCFCGDPQNVIDYGARTLANSSCNVRCTNDTAGSNGGEICGGQNALSYYQWKGEPLNSWNVATGNAAGAYQFLIGGVVIPLIVTPARNGKVTFVERFGTSQNASSTGAYELDLAQLNDFSKAWRTMHVKTDVFCAASLTIPDRAGRQIDVGGWSAPSTKGVRLYWPDGSPGVPGRWYPSAMILANGSILVVGGEEGSNGAPVPSLEILPSPSGQVLYADYLERTDPNNLYPFLTVLPSGRIFIQYYNEAKLLDPVSLQPVKTLPNAPGAVNNAASGRTYPFAGTMMILPQSPPYTDLEVLICGGSTAGAAVALDNCVSMKPDSPSANWTLERMPSKRVMPCMTALPDGTYLIVNGARQGGAGFGLATDPNLNAVLYDPTKPRGRRMTVMANTTIARLYHSESVLLDDGRVMITGSDPEDQKNPQEYRNEVFIPPYLMGNPARPAFNITNLDWSYGSSQTLSILSQGAGGAFRVSMMGAVSSTHGNSMGQRRFFLATSCSGSTCRVTAPPNANVCPPGWFQLFLLDGKGVPSKAIWGRVGGDPASLGNWPQNAGFTLPGMTAVSRLF
ncbi:WSC domain-containing protein [Fulvia fulva]|uniref:WSC domain-containing protein n=1 Tax=Passalora fulva TaxID=5499 RepID=A0A9Q8PDG1_PASFU|nr:WSC domain-containing protein [Fulvia fulva]UJO20415.1 WSC domain-containing protein [Fulvia fulva]